MLWKTCSPSSFLPQNTRELAVLAVPTLCSTRQPFLRADWNTVHSTSGCGWAAALDSCLPSCWSGDDWWRHIPASQESLICGDAQTLLSTKSFMPDEISFGWGWGGATFLLQIPFPVTSGSFQGTEQAAKASYCSLCWHCHSASSCSIARANGESAGCFPATNSWMFPSWEAALVLGRRPDAMKSRERPQANYRTGRKGSLLGEGQRERLWEGKWQ